MPLCLRDLPIEASTKLWNDLTGNKCLSVRRQIFFLTICCLLTNNASVPAHAANYCCNSSVTGNKITSKITHILLRPSETFFNFLVCHLSVTLMPLCLHGMFFSQTPSQELRKKRSHSTKLQVKKSERDGAEPPGTVSLLFLSLFESCRKSKLFIPTVKNHR